MTIETGIERLAALALFLTCLSHIAPPGAWVRLFAAVLALGKAGLINDWLGIVVALVGWALVAKGTIHLTIPSAAVRSLQLVDDEAGARRLRLGRIANAAA